MTPKQFHIEAVRRMSPKQVDEALRGGQLDDLLGRPMPLSSHRSI